MEGSPNVPPPRPLSLSQPPPSINPESHSDQKFLCPNCHHIVPAQSVSMIKSPILDSQHTSLAAVKPVHQFPQRNGASTHFAMRPASLLNHVGMNSPSSSSTSKLVPATGKPMPLQQQLSKYGVGAAATDTPETSAPASPRISIQRQNSGGSTPRMRPTTLDIPGLTKSKVSPDGRIAQRDVGSKLVIIMVGLPARGKSYITKKIARYLNWLQHETKIFNVGERRRIVAHLSPQELPDMSAPELAARALMNGSDIPIPTLSLPGSVATGQPNGDLHDENGEEMDQSATFFDPSNSRAAQIREQCALDTLDDLIHYITEENGSVGILDATNSTLARRQLIMQRLRDRAGPVNVLFVESVCEDPTLLETNMRLKLSGPDYKDKDPVSSLEDFKKRVANYEKSYAPLGDYEEKHGMPYIKMIDVGRKLVTCGVHGFLSNETVSYLMNFNLAPRQIWITRHGESLDNIRGRIGGDSELSENGHEYAKALTKFITHMRQEWDIHQQDKLQNMQNPDAPGDHTPPNPHVARSSPYMTKSGTEQNFCVWTSMLKRSVQTGEYFNDDDFDVKQMRMLNELYAGTMEGMTYEEIKDKHADDYHLRQNDKMGYRYPGPGGEGYLHVISRVRPVITELERMEDHCLLIIHRSIARVILSYFMGLRQDNIANLDCPLGMVYSLEPKPYGVEFKAYRYNPQDGGFDYLPDYQLQRQTTLH